MELATILPRFRSALPGLKAWIDQILADHASKAKVVKSSGYTRLHDHYPDELLGRAKAVIVPRVPFPPLSQFGLREFANLGNAEFDGITFKDTFFVQRERRTEELYFHELTHVIQWERLGMDRFLLAYGVGLLAFGYDKSPLERIAFDLTGLFAKRAVPADLVAVVQKNADTVWKQVEPLFQSAS